MELKAKLLEKYGKVLGRFQHSNAYTGVLIKEIEWRGKVYSCVWVDGMLCDIETTLTCGGSCGEREREREMARSRAR